MDAGMLGREKRALEMHAEQPGPDRLVRHLRERGGQVGLAGTDERRLERSDARLEHRGARNAVSGRIGRREVDASEAVHVQIDEAGHRDAPARPGEADARDAAVQDLDVALQQDAVDQRCFDAESQRRISLTEEPASLLFTSRRTPPGAP